MTTLTFWIWATNEDPPAISTRLFPSQEACLSDLQEAVGDSCPLKLVQRGVYEWNDKDSSSGVASISAVNLRLIET